MNKHVRSSLFLLATAAIWGASFVAQSKGAEYVGPYTFNTVRSFIAGFTLLAIVFFSGRKKSSADAGASNAAKRGGQKLLYIGGLACGAALAAACALQQKGIALTTVGKAGFLTSLYIVLVPMIGALFGGKVKPIEWIAALLSIAGIYLICVTETFSIGKGDLLMLACAVCYTVHILVVGYFSPRVDCIRLSCLQFFFCGGISALLMFIFEKPVFFDILRAWIPIFYAGFLSSAIGYTFQIISQKNIPPTITSLILSLESVFSVVFGWVLLNQSLLVREMVGCLFVFAAITLAQTYDLMTDKKLHK